MPNYSGGLIFLLGGIFLMWIGYIIWKRVSVSSTFITAVNYWEDKFGKLQKEKYYGERGNNNTSAI